MVKGTARRRQRDSAPVKWKEPLGLVLTCTGLVVALLMGVLIAYAEIARREGRPTSCGA
jgi:hypothetical protein